MRKAKFSSSYFTFILSFQENGLRSKGWKERQTKSGNIGQLRLAKSPFLMDNSRRRPGGVLPWVPPGSTLYPVLVAPESSMTCVKSRENCFQEMCKVWGGTWAGAGVWVDKQAGKMCYRTRTWALEDGWTWKDWKSAGLAQGSMKTTGGSLSSKSPWQSPCTTVEVVDPKRKPEEDI